MHGIVLPVSVGAREVLRAGDVALVARELAFEDDRSLITKEACFLDENAAWRGATREREGREMLQFIQ